METDEDTAARPCPGCGVVARPADGPTHPYIGASPGCWAMFNELQLAGEGLGVAGQLVVDTYAVQHPGVPERRAIQSVCAHLVSMCAALEHRWPADRGPDLLKRALASQEGWRWLDPVLPVGAVTVADVLAITDADARGQKVREWADDVWMAYEPHHRTVRGWLAAALG